MFINKVEYILDYLWLGGGNESAGSDKKSTHGHIFFNISRFEMRYKVDIDNQTKIDNTPWWMNYQKGNLYFNQK